MVPRAVLFDLDGTLVQTREASWKIFIRTSEAFGLGVATQQEFFRLLEDNLFAGLRRICGDDRRAQEAARHFLGQLEADYAPEFVPGMVDVVKALAGNCSLAVVSSNSIATIRRIMTRASLAHCFSHVFGGDVEPDKRSVLRRFLADQSYLVNRECSPAYRESDRPIQAGLQIRPGHRYDRRREARPRMRRARRRRRLGHAQRASASCRRRGVCRSLAAGTHRASAARRICERDVRGPRRAHMSMRREGSGWRKLRLRRHRHRGPPASRAIAPRREGTRKKVGRGRPFDVAEPRARGAGARGRRHPSAMSRATARDAVRTIGLEPTQRLGPTEKGGN